MSFTVGLARDCVTIVFVIAAPHLRQACCIWREVCSCFLSKQDSRISFEQAVSSEIMLSCIAFRRIYVQRNKERPGNSSHGRVVRPYERKWNKNIRVCNLDRRRRVFFFLLGMPGFTSRAHHVGFAVDKLVLGHIFLRVLRGVFLSFYQCCF